MRREWITSAIILICLIAGGIFLVYSIQPAADPVAPAPQATTPKVQQSDTTRFITLRLNPATTPISMYWRDDNGNDLLTLQRLRDYVEKQGKRLRFAMNGGMYHENHLPVGLFIQNGRLLSPLDTSSGKGNFYLKPNGVFLVRKDRTATVVTTDRFTYTNDIEFATQSGPMLLIDGAIHPVFEKDSQHLNIRNGVGVRPDGGVVFAMSKGKVTLYDFATYFKEMGCNNALYLDGFVSRCYFPEEGWVQLDGYFVVMIGVVE